MIEIIKVHHEVKDYFGRRDNHMSENWKPDRDVAEAAVRKLFRRFRQDGCTSEVMHIITDEEDSIGRVGVDHVVAFEYDYHVDEYRAEMFEWESGSRTERRPVTMADVMRIIRANYEESE